MPDLQRRAYTSRPANRPFDFERASLALLRRYQQQQTRIARPAREKPARSEWRDPPALRWRFT